METKVYKFFIDFLKSVSLETEDWKKKIKLWL